MEQIVQRGRAVPSNMGSCLHGWSRRVSGGRPRWEKWVRPHALKNPWVSWPSGEAIPWALVDCLLMRTVKLTIVIFPGVWVISIKRGESTVKQK